MSYCNRTDAEIISELERWVEKHFAPDEWCLALGEKKLTPREFLQAIKNNDPAVTDSLDVMNFLRESGKRFDRDPLDFIEQTIQNNKNIIRS
ncbi:MAG: hypothetical protein AAB968_03025 [Patescibacteria group bacterium]